MRRRGISFKRIAASLDVSPASVVAWTRDIELTAEQRYSNLYGPRGPQSQEQIAKRVAAWQRKSRERRLAWQLEGRIQARNGDARHIAGCMLYWAEGAKNRNTLTFANSDQGMVRFFAQFLKESLGVSGEDFRVRLNVYTTNGLSIMQIEDHWLSVLGLPRSCLRGHTLNNYPTSSSGAKRNRLPYGVCTIKIARSTRLVQHIFGAIQEYAGWDDPRWLDCLPGKAGGSTSSAEH
jgi:hypothetical protein